MKLSEILKDFPEKKEIQSVQSYGRQIELESWNRALTSCDREIDKKDLLYVFQKLETFPHPEDKFDYFISTMPTWLRKVSDE